MKKHALILASALVIGSITANAQFSTSEFGSGNFSTGDGSPITTSSTPDEVNSEICGDSDCSPSLPAAFTALGNSLTADGTASSDGSDEQDAIISFFDSNEDGSISASEVVYKYDSISTVGFSSVSTHQAGALLQGLGDHCTTEINETCLTSAANDANAFVNNALTDTNNLSALLTALEDTTGDYSVTDTDPLAVFDTNYDNQITDSEIVSLLALDPDAGSSVDTSDDGLYARAYISEFNDGETLSDAITNGNSWAVYPPTIGTFPTISMSGTDSGSQTSSVIPVYDGTCEGTDLSSCTASPANVSHTITQTHTPPGGTASAASGTLFQLNNSGQITLAADVDIEDLEAGTYTLNITSTDENGSDTYGLTTETAATTSLTVSNENGCITNTQVSGSDFDANTNSINGAAVRITGSFNSSDLLFIQGPDVTVSTIGANSIKRYQTLGVSGVTKAEYDPSTGIMRFYGTTTEANWVGLFQRVGYIFNSTNSPSDSTRTLAFTLSNRVGYLHDDGTYHYYEYFEDDNVTFSSARTKAAASNKQLFGMTGYLATPTSSEEQSVLTDKVQGIGWLGACDKLSDSTVRGRCGITDDEEDDLSNSGEGRWYWVTGPERLTYFGFDDESVNSGSGAWKEPTGNNANGTGKHTNRYENWNGTAGVSEPNNCCGSSEHYLHVWGSARWNDFAHYNGHIQGYLVEWGGLSSDPDVDLDQTVNYSIPAGDANFCTYAE